MPLPTAVGPASTTSRSPMPPCAATQSATNSRRRRRCSRPRPPRRLDRRDAEVVHDAARSSSRRWRGSTVRNSVHAEATLDALGRLVNGARAARRAGCARRSRSSALTAARARRAATAARDAATRSTSGAGGGGRGRGRQSQAMRLHTRRPDARSRRRVRRVPPPSSDRDSLAMTPPARAPKIRSAESPGSAPWWPNPGASTGRPGRGTSASMSMPASLQVGGGAEHDADRAEGARRGIRSALVPADDALRRSRCATVLPARLDCCSTRSLDRAPPRGSRSRRARTRPCPPPRRRTR